MTMQEEARDCERNAEIHLIRAARSASDKAREANLNLAAIYAAQSERLRSVQVDPAE